MLHVTIKNTETNEIIYDREVSVIAMQVVDGESGASIRHMAGDADLKDLLACIKIMQKAAIEGRKLLSETLTEVLGKVNLDDDDDPE